MKTVSKRDVSNETLQLLADDDEDKTSLQDDKKDQALSDNISLFQSLRVLQEGEGEDDSTTTEINSKSTDFYLYNLE